jgi:hypothetical protein
MTAKIPGCVIPATVGEPQSRGRQALGSDPPAALCSLSDSKLQSELSQAGEHW